MTHDVLREEIALWRRAKAARSRDAIRHLFFDLLEGPLCRRFLSLHCHGCPIMDRTGEKYCHGTPRQEMTDQACLFIVGKKEDPPARLAAKMIFILKAIYKNKEERKRSHLLRLRR